MSFQQIFLGQINDDSCILHSYRYTNLRFIKISHEGSRVAKQGIQYTVFMSLIVVLFLAACGGDDGDSSDSSGNNNDANTSNTAVVEATATPADLPALPTDANQPTPAPDVAATVNDAEILYTEFEREVNAQLASLNAPPADMSTFETEIINTMINQVLIEQYARENNIVVTDEAVQAELDILTQMADENGMDLTTIFGYPEDMIPEKMYDALLTQAVSTHVTDNAPLTVAQVHARHILVKDEALALELLGRLDAGEDFATLAQDYSEDPSSARVGGDLGWISPGDLLQQEVEDVIFEMPVNSRWPEPVSSVIGYHIIESLERVEDRPIDETKRTEQRQEIFAGWLADEIANADVVRFVGIDATR